MPIHPDYRLINLRLALAVISAFVFLCPITAGATGSLIEPQQNPLSAEFLQLDKNHDGRLTREEASHDSDFSSGLNNADLNHDGKLDEAEYIARKNELQQARMKEFLEDSTITARVKAELLKDNGVKGLSISVETHRGVVILSGFVDNDIQIHRAAEIASGVRGVTSVKNSLFLKG